MLPNLRQFASNLTIEAGSEEKAGAAIGVNSTTINKWRRSRVSSVQPALMEKIARYMRWSDEQTQFWIYSPLMIPVQECDRLYKRFKALVKGEDEPDTLTEVRIALDRLYAVLEDLESAANGKAKDNVPQSLTRYFQSAVNSRGFSLDDEASYREFCGVLGLASGSVVAKRLRAIAIHQAVADSADLADIGRALRSLGEEINFEKLALILQDKASISK